MEKNAVNTNNSQSLNHHMVYKKKERLVTAEKRVEEHDGNSPLKRVKDILEFKRSVDRREWGGEIGQLAREESWTASALALKRVTADSSCRHAQA